MERWRTIIEPFRIKSVEPVRMTTAEERAATLAEAGFLGVETVDVPGGDAIEARLNEWRRTGTLIQGKFRSEVVDTEWCTRSIAERSRRRALAALRDASNETVLEHCRRIAGLIPLVGFYLQPAVGGRVLDSTWLAEIGLRTLRQVPTGSVEVSRSRAA